MQQQLDCYLINLDRSADRLEKFMQSFGTLNLNVIRFPAVEGVKITFPHPEFDEKRYHLYHGKRKNPNEIGCFFSHVMVLRMFLESNKEHALICEDDVTAKPELLDVINAALRYKKIWDLLRLNGLHQPFQCPIANLGNGYKLCVPLTWFGGTGAYLVNRNAAERILKSIVPMRVPYDHALDQNWLMRIRAASVKPYPIQLNETATTSFIIPEKKYKLPFFRRYVTVLPYRAVMTLGRWGTQISVALVMLVVRPKPK